MLFRIKNVDRIKRVCSIFSISFFTFFFFMSNNLMYADDGCPSLFSMFAPSEETVQDPEILAMSDVRKFEELSEIIEKHPLHIYNAAQRLLAVIMSLGTKEITKPGVDGKVTKYNIFSEPNEYNDGRFIVGQEEAINSFVENLKSQAEGTSKVVFFIGPAGTGKTLFSDIYSRAIRSLSLKDPRFKVYTYKWIGLDQIPNLKGLFRYDEYLSPLAESPFALLPEEMQRAVLSKVKPIDLGVGEPRPTLGALNPHDSYIRQQILKHYGAFTPDKIVEAINKHVVLQRVIPGDSRSPIIDAQGENYQEGELFVSTEPYRGIKLGSENPLSYKFGKVTSAHMSILILDEFLRNAPALIDMFLRLFESHDIALAGSPLLKLDFVPIVISNTEKLNEILQDTTLKAMLDRLYSIPFWWSLNPQHIIETTLFMADKGRSSVVEGRVYTEALNLDNEKITDENRDKFAKKHINFAEVFKDRSRHERMYSTDYRYKVYVNTLDKEVFVNPHVLTFLGYLVAATRMETDPKKTQNLEAFSVVGTRLFRDIIVRLKYLTGQYIPSSLEEERELHKISILLKEGNSGISARDTANWFEAAIAEAATNNNGELTLDVLIKVLHSQLAKGTISTSGKDSLRLKWKDMAETIIQELILPKIESDIFTALGRDKEFIDKAYHQVLAEIVAINNDSSATQYEDPVSNTIRFIDKERLEQIKKIFERRTGYPLSIEQIATYYTLHAYISADNSSDQSYNADLKEAITEYYVKNEMKGSSLALDALVSSAKDGVGSSEVAQRSSQLVDGLMKLGYSRYGALQAMDWVKHYATKTKQANGK